MNIIQVQKNKAASQATDKKYKNKILLLNDKSNKILLHFKKHPIKTLSDVKLVLQAADLLLSGEFKSRLGMLENSNIIQKSTYQYILDNIKFINKSNDIYVFINSVRDSNLIPMINQFSLSSCNIQEDKMQMILICVHLYTNICITQYEINKSMPKKMIGCLTQNGDYIDDFNQHSIDSMIKFILEKIINPCDCFNHTLQRKTDLFTKTFQKIINTDREHSQTSNDEIEISHNEIIYSFINEYYQFIEFHQKWLNYLR